MEGVHWRLFYVFLVRKKADDFSQRRCAVGHQIFVVAGDAGRRNLMILNAIFLEDS